MHAPEVFPLSPSFRLLSVGLALALPLATSCQPAPEDGAGGDDDSAGPEPEPEPVPNPYLDFSYLLDLSSVEVLAPEGGEILVSLLEGQFLIAAIVGGEDDRIDVAATLALIDGKSVAQDPCVPVVRMDDGAYDPDTEAVAVGPADFAVSIDPGLGIPIDVVLRAFSLSGTFVGAGSAIEQVSVDATFDMRDYAELFDAIGFGDGCSLIEMYAGIECQPCPGDGEEQCVNLELGVEFMDYWGGDFTLEPEEPAGGC